MPGSTPKGHPYPLATEPVSQGAGAIQALATSVDDLLPARQFLGRADIVLAAAASGSVVITFPAGRFAVAPRLLLGCTNFNYFAAYGSTTTTAATISVRHYKDTTASTTVQVAVHALQIGAAATDG